MNRIQYIKGKWTIFNNIFVLSAESENVLYRGYLADHPNTPYIDKGTPVVIIFEKPIKITLPLNESEAYEKYNFTWSEKWIMIGSADCYISEE